MQTSFPPSAVSEQVPSELDWLASKCNDRFWLFNQPVRLLSMEHEAKTVHLFEHTYDLTKPSDRQALKNIAKGILDVL